jgi:hypothetical protein
VDEDADADAACEEAGGAEEADDAAYEVAAYGRKLPQYGTSTQLFMATVRDTDAVCTWYVWAQQLTPSAWGDYAAGC